MIKQAIEKLIAGKDLKVKEAEEVFVEIFEHKASSAQIASFLTALKIKGEKEDEILAAASVIRAKANKLNLRDDFLGIEDKDQPILDTCGTGGSGLNKFNISTATSFVVAASGVKVAKHGNKAMSSNCGSADVLEALGINIASKPQVMEEAIRKIGIGFLYAPLYHPALKEVAGIRREIGVRTIFNILGPLCNPASANFQLLGVYSRNLVLPLVRVLKKLGAKKAAVIHSKDLGDEVSLAGPTYIGLLNNKKINSSTLNPSSFGLKKIKLKSLMVKDKQESAKVITGIFNGQKGACRDIVLANASVCFYILGKAANFKQGVKLGFELIDSGQVKAKFLKFKQFIGKNA
jgi:anthranilate phosphoribosyltransferase